MISASGSEDDKLLRLHSIGGGPSASKGKGRVRLPPTLCENASLNMHWRRYPFVFCLTTFLLGAGQAWSESLKEWTTQASREISRQVRRPPSYRRTTAPMTTVVQFVVGPEGSVSDIVIAKGSGSADLDNAVVSAVRSARPLPSPPMPPNMSSLKATLPIVFY